MNKLITAALGALILLAALTGCGQAAEHPEPTVSSTPLSVCRELRAYDRQVSAYNDAVDTYNATEQTEPYQVWATQHDLPTEPPASVPPVKPYNCPQEAP